MGMNRLLGKGTRYENSIHAEEQAIKRLAIRGKRLMHRHLSFLIIRKQISGKLGMSKPCLHCLKKIRDLAERWKLSITVYYSTGEGDIQVENVQNMSGILLKTDIWAISQKTR